VRCIAIFVTCVVWASAAVADCAPDRVSVRGDFGEARFTVEIADEPDERALGLMHRPSMPMSAGMLFVYESPRSLAFWMRDTLIELDIIFVDAQGIIQHIHHRAQPLDETPILGGDDLTHVLEINGGLARDLGIDEGDALRHPSFVAPDAAWPC